MNTKAKAKKAQRGFKNATSFHTVYFTPKDNLQVYRCTTSDGTQLLTISTHSHDITIDICTKEQARELHRVTGEIVDFFTHKKKGTAK